MSSCGALFAACEPAAQTFGNTARKECRHDLRGSWHTVAAGLNLIELLADVRHHLLGHDVEQQYKAVRPDRGADQLLVRFCKFKYIIHHLIVESHRVIRRAVLPDAFVVVIDDLFYNECQQLVFIGEMLIEGISSIISINAFVTDIYGKNSTPFFERNPELF